MECEIEKPQYTLETLKLLKICKYHKYAYQSYRGDQLTFEICPVLHNTIYPYGLSAFYGSNEKRELTCPLNDEIKIRFLSKRKRSHFVNVFISIITKITRLFRMPWDIELHDVYYSIAGSRLCRFYKKDIVLKFNSDDRNSLCPASYYNIYPASLTGVEQVQCPDHMGITYKICRLK